MIKTISSVTEVPLFEGKNTSIFLDVDHTIITPHCFIAHPEFKYFRVFDALKKMAQEGRIPEGYIKHVLGIFRNERREVLIEVEWLSFTQRVKERGCKLLALTSLNTGIFPAMDCTVEEWRYNILRDLGIVFSEHDKIEKLTDDYVDYTINYRGIIQTGKYSKADSLEAYFTTINTKPKKIIFFDDRLSKLEEIESKAAEHNIEYIGYLYKGVECLQFSNYVAEKAHGQLEVLLKYGKLLRDEDVLIYRPKKGEELIDDTQYRLILDECVRMR